MSATNGQQQTQSETFRREIQTLREVSVKGVGYPPRSARDVFGSSEHQRLWLERGSFESEWPISVGEPDVDMVVRLPGAGAQVAQHVRDLLHRALGSTPSEAISVVRAEGVEQPQPKALLRVFDALVDAWGVSDSQAQQLLGFDREPALISSLMRRGLIALPRDVRDRIRTMTEIHRSLDFRFGGNADSIRAFLSNHCQGLGASPLEAMIGGGLEGLLRVRDYLRWMDGR